MKNNLILKKVCIANNLKHFELKEIFQHGDLDFSSSQIKAFMAGSQNKNHIELTDDQLEAFFNGFIIYSRGNVDDPSLLPRTIENFIIGLIEAGNTDALEEIRCLIEDAADQLEKAD